LFSIGDNGATHSSTNTASFCHALAETDRLEIPKRNQAGGTQEGAWTNVTVATPLTFSG